MLWTIQRTWWRNLFYTRNISKCVEILIPNESDWQGLVDAQHVEGMRPDSNVEEILSSVGRHVPTKTGAANTAEVGNAICIEMPISFFKKHRLILLEPIQCIKKCTLNMWCSSKIHQESKLSMNSSPSSFYRVQPIPEWTPIGNHELGPALTCSWLSHKNKLKLHVYNVRNPRPNIWGWFQPNPF